ncbi:hypothetical protein [Lactobacillus sp. ESL0677]|uniref:hypothetical protein n=1 Tax=Lactobacillus sp. ESL0677 TaxID=2983208 RepID=UPI0023F99797|nr:hypothetical protein [Lactobacillus sp. ESL0677]WEV37608.1 hypothetical protein OZX76_03380 [Lactobacillus sp. ESL0677]
MTEEEVIALCAGHDFVYKTGNPEIMIYFGRSAVLMIRLNPDHTIGFASHIEFYPSSRHWHWDQVNQCILFTDEADKKVIEKYAPPVVEAGKYISLVSLTKEHTRYVAYLTLNMYPAVQPAAELSRQRLMLIADKYVAANRIEINKYMILKQGEVAGLSGQSDWELINSAWQKLAHDSQIKHVCFSFSGLPPVTVEIFSDELQFQLADNKNQYIAGLRRDILLLLSQLLIKHNQQIMAEEKQLSPVLMLKDLIK